MVEITPASVKELRHRLQLTEEEFAYGLGLPVEMVRQWEKPGATQHGPGGFYRRLLQAKMRENGMLEQLPLPLAERTA